VKKELVIVLVAIAMAAVSIGQLDYHVGPWLNPVVLNGELEAAKWAHSTPKGSLFLAGIFGGELVMGMAARPSIIGGDWAANANSAQQMSDMQEFYLTPSAAVAKQIWERYNASYAWFPSREVYAGYGFIQPNERKTSGSAFELAYNNSEVRVYKLRKSN